MPQRQSKAAWIWAAILTLICLFTVPLRLEHDRDITPLLVLLSICGTLMTTLLILAFFVDWRFLIGWGSCGLAIFGYAAWETALSLSREHGLPGEAAPVLAFLLFASVVCLFYWQTRSKFLASIPKRLEFRPVDLASLPAGLNVDELEARTDAYLSLGFQQLLDFRSVGDAPSGVVLFGRMLVHPGHRCFAVLHQDFVPSAEPSPTKHNIISLLGEDWRLTTSAAPPSLASSVRLPRELVQRWLGTTPGELLEWHLQRRRGMVANIPAPVCQDLTPEVYLERGRIWLTKFRRQAERATFLLLVWRWWWRASGQVKHEWLGEYRTILDARGES